MPSLVQRITGAGEDATRGEVFAGCVRILSPLAAPFLILICEPRWETLAAASAWSLFVLPGALAIPVFFAPAHPLGRGAARPAVASVAALLPFGIISWTACRLHWTLSTVLLLYAGVYVISVVALVPMLLRRGAAREPARAHEPTREPSGPPPRWAAAIVAVGIALVMAGVAVASSRSPGGRPVTDGSLLQVTANRSSESEQPWWHGTALGVFGSLLAATGLVLGLRRARPASYANGDGSAAPGQRGRQRPGRNRGRAGADPRRRFSRSGAWLVSFLWVAVALMTLYLMKWSYALPPEDCRKPAWNSDDVTYVSQAVDYRYGIPLAQWEPSLGADRPLVRAELSPLVAPLVAALSRATGVECAALSHTVLPPLMILIGVSAMAAALLVVLRAHPWAVPLGLLVVLMMLYKSWDFNRSLVGFAVYRAMQAKSVHLLLLYPLQLATLLLVARCANKRDLLFGIAVAVVGHLAHPFATILGTVWATVMLAAVGLTHRRALPKTLALLAVYALLGAAYYAESKRPGPAQPASKGVTAATAPEGSRDLVRIDDKPILRQDVQIQFGYDVLFHLGALASPILLVLGWRRRELLYVGLIGLVAVACCNSTFLGRWLNLALPVSILWRTRWMLPSLVNLAVLCFGLYWAVCALIRKRDGSTPPVRSFLGSVLVTVAVAGMLSATRSYALKLGPRPERLSKFSNDLHDLVPLLGGIEADSFVWGPAAVTRELPQLMPNIRLVLSRRRIVRAADHPRFRDFARYMQHKFLRGDVNLREFQLLLRLYPIDSVVIDRGLGQGRQPAALLRNAGWEPVGRAGRYELWRAARQASAPGHPR